MTKLFEYWPLLMGLYWALLMVKLAQFVICTVLDEPGDSYCNKRRGLIYAEFIVGIIQQIFSYQLSDINCKYHAYSIILLPVIA